MLMTSFFDTIQTGSGFWNPIIWIGVFVIAFLIIYILRGFGKNEYKKQSSQTQSFLSGNPEYEKEKMHIKGSNIYWGIIGSSQTLKWFYDHIFRKMHNGYIGDYVLWFIVVLAVFFIFIGVIL